LGFFGLTPQDKPKLHEQIFQLMYYGKGFIHSDVYNMPVYLRNFYYKQLSDTRTKENEQIKKANQRSKVSKPSINPRFKR
jgi:hypothetical protein|tara:strand:- start:456 stop:695 length:240 start_codon:yes stop_codon:yes gene_type:complete